MRVKVGLVAMLCTASATMAQVSGDEGSRRMEQGIAAHEEGHFLGWPANNGVWTWDDGREILVGCSYGRFVEQEGHNIQGKSDAAKDVVTRLARSIDGGLTWTIEDPENFVGDGAEILPSPGDITFTDPGFALRVVGIGYHGAYDEEGHFFVSQDRGKTWRGAYRFGDLMSAPELEGMQFTSRTGYVVTGPASCLVFMSARAKEGGGGRDKSFVAETADGGASFHFLSWIVPLDDPYRAVMPSPVRLADGRTAVALRRRIPPGGEDVNWVDCYVSADGGRTWTFQGRVGETGDHNGNPPALAALEDGRLACAYGDRTRARMYLRLSDDGGATWGEEVVLRDDFKPDRFGDMDFGYPRLVQNHRGELVATYYWSTEAHFEQHIAVTRIAR